MARECDYCKEGILKRELFVLLGTYEGKKTIETKRYHLHCWKLFFEKQTKEKAQNIVNAMQKKIMPMAKKMIGNAMGMN